MGITVAWPCTRAARNRIWWTGPLLSVAMVCLTRYTPSLCPQHRPVAHLSAVGAAFAQTAIVTPEDGMGFDRGRLTSRLHVVFALLAPLYAISHSVLNDWYVSPRFHLLQLVLVRPFNM